MTCGIETMERAWVRARNGTGYPFGCVADRVIVIDVMVHSTTEVCRSEHGGVQGVVSCLVGQAPTELSEYY